MSKSELFIELVRVFRKPSVHLLTNGKAKKNYSQIFDELCLPSPNFRNLLLFYIEKGKDLTEATNSLLKDLSRFKVYLIADYSKQLYENQYEKIIQTQSQLELGFLSEGRGGLDEIWENEENIPYWQKWSLIELESEFYSPREKKIGFTKQYHPLLQSIAKEICNRNSSGELENEINSIKQNTLKFILNQIYARYDLINYYKDEIESVKKEYWQIKYFGKEEEADPIENEKKHLIIIRFFELSFEFLHFIISTPDDKITDIETISEVINSINDFKETIKGGSILFLPNLLTVYLIKQRCLLEIYLALIPRKLKSEHRIELHPNVFFSVDHFRDELVIYDILLIILSYDGFEHDLGDVGLNRLIYSFEKLHEILDGKKSKVFKDVSELGLKCLYVLLARILRSDQRKYSNRKYEYENEDIVSLIEEPQETERRRSIELKKIEFYRKVLIGDFTNLKQSAGDLLQLCCLKVAKGY